MKERNTMDTRINDPGSDRFYRSSAIAPAIDLGLRRFMLRVFHTMAGGLVLTGVLVFTGLIAWDTQRLKAMDLENGGTGNLAILAR
jgi:FtsH-binding integral membrane protein